MTGEYHTVGEEILYRSNIYTWIVKISEKSKRMNVRVVAKDEDEARKKAIGMVDDMKDWESMKTSESKEWRDAFAEQISRSPVMVVKGDYDVFITFFESN